MTLLICFRLYALTEYGHRNVVFKKAFPQIPLTEFSEYTCLIYDSGPPIADFKSLAIAKYQKLLIFLTVSIILAFIVFIVQVVYIIYQV